MPSLPSAITGINLPLCNKRRFRTGLPPARLETALDRMNYFVQIVKERKIPVCCGVAEPTVPGSALTGDWITSI